MQIPDWNEIAGSTEKPSQEQIERVMRIVKEVQALPVLDRQVCAYLIAIVVMDEMKELKGLRK